MKRKKKHNKSFQVNKKANRTQPIMFKINTSPFMPMEHHPTKTWGP